VPEAEVTHAMRRIGKTINFGVIYGMSGFRLSRDLKIPRKEGDAFIETYFERYSGVARFRAEIISEAEDRGYVKTILGRRRNIPQITSRNRTEKNAGERMAVNTIIQGSAADLMKMAMLRVYAALEAYQTNMILQVHDEIVMEAREEELEEVSRIVKSAMESVYSLDIPLRINLESGKTWGSIH
jgi:DNA polymerase-1